ncbi:MAG: M1 family peptidase, partial [Rhodothermales bacterium]
MLFKSPRVLLTLFGLLTTPAARAQGSPEWQQRVAYEMDVTLLADSHRMKGRQRLLYENNSPDTLRNVYYHLYFNAFNPNSMMAERNRHLPDPDGRIVPRIFNLSPDEIGYHEITSLTQDGAP